MPLITLFYISCVEDGSHKPQPPLNTDRYDRFTVDVRAWRNEVFHIDSLELSDGITLSPGVPIHFECNPNLYIRHPNIQLSSKTAAAEFGLLYPESSKLTLASGNAWSGKIEVFATNNKNDPRVWTFFFRNERLNSLELSNPFSNFKDCPPNE